MSHHWASEDQDGPRGASRRPQEHTEMRQDVSESPRSDINGGSRSLKMVPMVPLGGSKIASRGFQTLPKPCSDPSIRCSIDVDIRDGL